MTAVLPQVRKEAVPDRSEGERGRPKVLVLGATGSVGRATVRALVKSGFSVVACTRNPKSEKARAIDDPDVKLFTMTSPDSLKGAVEGCDTAVVIPPGTEDRSKWAVDVIEKLQSFGLSKIVLISVPFAKPDANFHFGREFGEMEKNVRAKGVKPVIVRLPMFMENLFGNVPMIKRDGKLMWRAKPDARYTPVSVTDVGEAIAVILGNIDAHIGKEYVLCAPAVSANDLAKMLSAIAGKKVNVTEVDDAGFLEGMRGLGLPPWQAKGVLELFKLVDEGRLDLRSKDLQTLIGRTTTVEDFLNDDFKNALLAA